MVEVGQKVRFVLSGDRYYSGKVVAQDEFLIEIIDKFGNEVSLGKQSIISLEVLK